MLKKYSAINKVTALILVVLGGTLQISCATKQTQWMNEKPLLTFCSGPSQANSLEAKDDGIALVYVSELTGPPCKTIIQGGRRIKL
jgi:hypothetical protein